MCCKAVTCRRHKSSPNQANTGKSPSMVAILYGLQCYFNQSPRLLPCILACQETQNTKCLFLLRYYLARFWCSRPRPTHQRRNVLLCQVIKSHSTVVSVQSYEPYIIIWISSLSLSEQVNMLFITLIGQGEWWRHSVTLWFSWRQWCWSRAIIGGKGWRW